MSGNIVACHTFFDKRALEWAATVMRLTPLVCTWVNSATVARRTWRQFSRSGYNLKNLCMFLDYKFKHHDALEDAKAAGFVLCSAMSFWQTDIQGLIEATRNPPPRKKREKRSPAVKSVPHESSPVAAFSKNDTEPQKPNVWPLWKRTLKKVCLSALILVATTLISAFSVAGTSQEWASAIMLAWIVGTIMLIVWVWRGK